MRKLQLRENDQQHIVIVTDDVHFPQTFIECKCNVTHLSIYLQNNFVFITYNVIENSKVQNCSR